MNNKVYQFNTDDAEAYGVDAAVMLWNMRYWLERNLLNRRNLYDGRVWTHNSIEALTGLFPWLTEKQVRSRIDKLRKRGVVIAGNYNKKAYDRTLWYSVDEAAFIVDDDKSPDKPDKPDKPKGPDTNAVEYRLSLLLLDAIVEYDDTHKFKQNAPALRGWANQIRLAMEKDGRTAENLEGMIRYIFSARDKIARFWAPNINSGKKLRDKYDTIKNQVRRQYGTDGMDDTDFINEVYQ